jgi:multiple sugar transport system ATP-binding protein
MAEVVLERVTKVFPGNVVAVSGMDLHVGDQEFLVLVGPSGCGKTTTLRAIAGLEEITEGTIRIGPRVVNDVAPKDRDIAMVFQNYALYPHMTVYQNMAFGLKLRKFPRKEIEDRVAEAARILGIEGLLNRKPRQLSGGQRQRVAVGRAIVRKPAAFLFDEPLSNLDAKLRVEMRKELNELHHRLQSTMIYVTHDQIEAMTLGDRIVVMHEGLIQQVGPPVEVYDFPRNKFVAGFVGTPPMNFLAGRLVKNSEQVSVEADGVSIPLRPEMGRQVAGYVDQRVDLGIRPEDVQLVGSRRPIDEGARLTATVNVVEPLGHEKIVYFSVAGQELLGKIDVHDRVERGSRVEIVLNMRRAHVFEQKDGSNVTREVGNRNTL